MTAAHPGYNILDPDNEGPAVEETFNIDSLQLEDEFVKLPAKLAYYNALHAQAAKIEGLAKVKLGRLEADLYVNHREQMELDPSVGRVTEKMVESAVERDPTLHEAQATYFEIKRKKGVLSGYCEAIRTKRDMLIQLGAHIRAEMERDPSIRSERAGSDAGRTLNE
jgi:hypothetical protein